MASGESTKRSQLGADEIMGVVQAIGAAELRQESEILCVLDGSELRREWAQEQEYLMRVKSLEGGLVNGYRTLNVLGLGAKEKRGILYHHLFSSQAPDFESENTEIEQAIDSVQQGLAGQTVEVTWVMDSGFDNDLVWWKVWEKEAHLVCRVHHLDRIVQVEVAPGVFQERYLDATFSHLKRLARLETELEVRLHGQKRARRQKVTVEIAASPIWVYTDEKQQPRQTKKVWLVRVEVAGAVEAPWYLITDWPVIDESSAVRIFIFYRRRWSVEDAFKFLKTVLGMESVQVLDFDAVRTLVAFAWVAAGFLFKLGLSLDLPEIRLLAILGGWEERANRPPGKIILSRGLRRLLDKFATDALLRQYKEEHGELPGFVRAMAKRYGLPEI
ncbi:MAG: transposase [Anaerolineaceae bacterium]|nr:transposase [Anaerolineaceae bacterium]